MIVESENHLGNNSQQLVDETNETVSSGTSVPDAADEQSPTAPTFDPAYESRRQRIFELRANAQAEIEPLAACLAGVNSDLFDLELNLGEQLRHAMASNPDSLEGIEQHARPIDMLLRVVKQIAQITQIGTRIQKPSQDAAMIDS